MRGIFIVLFTLFASPILHAGDDVKINILAVNPSDTNKLDTAIVHYLPPEVKPEDVIDRAGMDVNFDPNKQVYYLTMKITLEPKETRTIGIRVKNVWTLPDESISKTREELNQNLKSLEGTDYFDTAKLLYEKVSEQLNMLEEGKGKAIGMRQRIELFRAQTKELDAIQKQVISLESMKKLKGDKDAGVRTTKFVITAENPSSEAKKMTIRAELPKEITPDDILDRLGFLLLYDSTQKRYILEKEDALQGKEKKKYEITLRDVWYIPKEQLDVLKKQTDTLLGHFKGSPYENFSKQHGEFISSTLDSINVLQEEVVNATVIDDKIRAYVLNSSRLELIKQKIKDLEDLLLEIPIKRQETAIEQIRKAVKSISHIIDIIKLGFKPDLSTTWWIILGIIAFLFVMAASFYVIWVSKLKDVKKAKKPDKKDVKKEKTQAAEVPGAVAGGGGAKTV